MQKTAKILVTVVIVAIFIVLYGLVMMAKQHATGSNRPGFIGIILFVGLIASLRAIWKKDKTEND